MKLTDLMQAKGIGTSAPRRHDKAPATRLPPCTCHHHCGDVPEEDDFWSACKAIASTPDSAP